MERLLEEADEISRSIFKVSLNGFVNQLKTERLLEENYTHFRSLLHLELVTGC
jgi:hypothetical protein